MHNCKTTREQMTELLLSGIESGPVELMTCRECLNEFESLKETLRLTTRAIEAAAPATKDWANYKFTLKQKLADPSAMVKQDLAVRPENWLRRWLTASIRVPVPVGAAIVLLFAVSLVLALQRSRKTEIVQTVSVVKVPVEVPVIQEKVVTRIVYRQSVRQNAFRLENSKPDNSTIAKSQSTPVSLSEFKPLDEVKLRIIKGGSPDEK